MLRAVVPGNESVFSLLRSASTADNSHERLLLLDTIRDAVLSASPSSLPSLRAEFASDVDLLRSLIEVLTDHDEKEAEGDLPEPFLLLSVIARLFPPSESASLAVWSGAHFAEDASVNDPTIGIVVEAGLVDLIRAGFDCEDFSGRTTLASLEVLRNFCTLSVAFCQRVIVTLDVRNIVIGLLNCPVSDIVLDEFLATYVHIRTVATSAVCVLLFHHSPSEVALESAVVVNILTGVMHAVDLELLAMRLGHERIRGRSAVGAVAVDTPSTVQAEARFVDGPTDELMALLDAQLAAVVMLCISDAPRIPLAAQATFGDAPLLLLVRVLSSNLLRVVQVRETAHALRLVLGPKRMRESRAESLVRNGAVPALLWHLTTVLPTLAVTGRDNIFAYVEEPRSAVFPAVVSCMRTLVTLLQCSVPAARGSVLLSSQFEDLLALYLRHPASPYRLGKVQEAVDLVDVISPGTVEAAVAAPLFAYLHSQTLVSQAMDVVECLLPTLLDLPPCTEPGGAADKLTEHMVAQLCALLISIPVNAAWVDPAILPVKMDESGLPSADAVAASSPSHTHSANKYEGEIIPRVFEGTVHDSAPRRALLERAQHAIYVLAKRASVKAALVQGGLLPAAKIRLFLAMQTSCPWLYEITVRLMERLREDPDNVDLLDVEELASPTVQETVVATKIQSALRASRVRAAYISMTTALRKFTSSALWEKERVTLEEDEARSSIAEEMQTLISSQLKSLRAELALCGAEQQARAVIEKESDDSLASNILAIDEGTGRRCVVAAQAAAFGTRTLNIRSALIELNEESARKELQDAQRRVWQILMQNAFVARTLVQREEEIGSVEHKGRMSIYFKALVAEESMDEIEIFIELNDAYALLRAEQRLDRWVARCEEAQAYLLHEHAVHSARTMLGASVAMEAVQRSELVNEWAESHTILAKVVDCFREVGAAIQTRVVAHDTEMKPAITFQELLLREVKERASQLWYETRVRLQLAEEYQRTTVDVLEGRAFRQIITSTAQDQEESRRLVILAGERRALVRLAWFPEWSAALHALHDEEKSEWSRLRCLEVEERETIFRHAFHVLELSTCVYRFGGKLSQFSTWAHSHIEFVEKILAPFVEGSEQLARISVLGGEEEAWGSLVSRAQERWVEITVGDGERTARAILKAEALDSYFHLCRTHCELLEAHARDGVLAAQWTSRLNMVYDYAMDERETYGRDAIIAQWARESRGKGLIYANAVMATKQTVARLEVEASEARFRAYIEDAVPRNVVIAQLKEVVSDEFNARLVIDREQSADTFRSLQEAQLVFVEEPAGRGAVEKFATEDWETMELCEVLAAEEAARHSMGRELKSWWRDDVAIIHSTLTTLAAEEQQRNALNTSEANDRVALWLNDLTTREALMRNHIVFVEYKNFCDGALFQQGSTTLAQREWSRRRLILVEEVRERSKVQDSLFVASEKSLFSHHLRVRALLQMDWAVHLSQLRAEIARVRIDAEEEPSRRAEIECFERERFRTLCGHAVALAERVDRSRVVKAEALHRASVRVEAAEAIERALMQASFYSSMLPLKMEIVLQTERQFRWRMTEFALAFRRATGHAASLLDCLQSESFMRGLLESEYEAGQRYLCEEGSSILRMGIVAEYTTTFHSVGTDFRRDAIMLSEAKVRAKVEAARITDLIQLTLLMQHSARYVLQSEASVSLRVMEKEAGTVALLHLQVERRRLMDRNFDASMRSLLQCEEEGRRRAIQLEHQRLLERSATRMLGRVHASMCESDARGLIVLEATREKGTLLERANALGRCVIGHQWAVETRTIAVVGFQLKLEAAYFDGVRRIRLHEKARRYVFEEALSRGLRADERVAFMERLTFEKDVLLLVRMEAIERRAIVAQRDISSQSIRSAPFVGAMARARAQFGTKESSARALVMQSEGSQRSALARGQLEAEEVVSRRDVLVSAHRSLAHIAKRLHRTILATQPDLRVPTGGLMCACCSEPMLIPHTVVSAERNHAARAAAIAAVQEPVIHPPVFSAMPLKSVPDSSPRPNSPPTADRSVYAAAAQAPSGRDLRQRKRGSNTVVTVPPELLAPPTVQMRPIPWQPAGDEALYAQRMQRVLSTLPFSRSRAEYAAVTLAKEWSGSVDPTGARHGGADTNQVPHQTVTSPPSRAVRALRRSA